jgi:hypothetical protein
LELLGLQNEQHTTTIPLEYKKRSDLPNFGKINQNQDFCSVIKKCKSPKVTGKTINYENSFIGIKKENMAFQPESFWHEC